MICATAACRLVSVAPGVAGASLAERERRIAGAEQALRRTRILVELGL
jgi:hypothetical protein